MSLITSRTFLIAVGATLLHLCVFALTSYLLATHADGMRAFVAQSDQHEYMLIANELRTEGRFALYPEFPPDTFRTPLYPLLIATVQTITGSFWALFVVHALLVGMIVYTTITLATFVLRERMAEWAGIILAVSSGPLILTVMGLGSDLLYTALFTLGVLTLAKALSHPQQKLILLTGVLLGLATLTRPVGILASLPVLVGILFIPVSWKLRVRYVVLGFVAFGLVLSPWYLRNASLSGDFFFSTITGYNFAYYNIPGSESFWNHTNESIERSKVFAPLGTEEPYALRLSTFTPQLTGIRNAFLKEHFVEYSLFHGMKMIPFFVGSGYNVINAVLAQQSPTLHIPLFPTESMNLTNILQKGDVLGAIKNLSSFWFVTLERLIWALAILFSLIAPLFAQGTTRRILLISALIVLTTMILVSPVTQPRYRVPAEPFIWIGALATCYRMFLYLRNVRYLKKY